MLCPKGFGQRRLLAVVFVLVLAGPQCVLAGGKPELPSDLAIVPRNAVGFLHLRAADLWKTDVANDVRYLINKAGPEAWQAFAKKSPIDPTTLDRITFIWLSQDMNDPFPRVDPESKSALIVVRTSKPFDRLPVILALGAKEKVYRDKLYYFNESQWAGLYLIDDRTLVIGSEDSLIGLFEAWRHRDRTGPLQAPLEEAAGKHHLVLGLNPKLIAKDKEAEFIPPQLQTLLTAHSACVTLSMDAQIRFNASLEFQNADQAREAETAAKQALQLARQGLMQPIAEMERILNDPDKTAVSDLPQHFAALVGLGFLREVDSQLKDAPLKRQDKVVKLPLTYKNQQHISVLVAFYGVAIGSMYSFDRDFFGFEREKGDQTVEKHLRSVVKAFEKYRDKHGAYPPPALYDRDGRPTLSWRVAILPFLDEDALYREFKLDEPWDSLHNKRLIMKMPKALQMNDDRDFYYRGRWKTSTQVFAGPNTVFEGPKGIREADIQRKVVLLARVAADRAVYWTKPADIAYDPDQPLPEVYGRFGDRIHVLLTDGTYRDIDKNMDEKETRSLIERGDDKSKKPKNPPPMSELETIWNDFARNDDAGTKKAWQGIASMRKTPEQTIAFVKERVKPVAKPDMKRISQCLTDLDSTIFKKRAQAIKELEAFGELAIPAIEKMLGDKSRSVETRRQLEALMQNVKSNLSADELRAVRAIEVLEQLNSADARAMLTALSGGADGALLTVQARSALSRLGR